jgi:hypothetical protein
VKLTTKFYKINFSWEWNKNTCAITIHSKNETMWLQRRTSTVIQNILCTFSSIQEQQYTIIHTTHTQEWVWSVSAFSCNNIIVVVLVLVLVVIVIVVVVKFMILCCSMYVVVLLCFCAVLCMYVVLSTNILHPWLTWFYIVLYCLYWLLLHSLGCF